MDTVSTASENAPERKFHNFRFHWPEKWPKPPQKFRGPLKLIGIILASVVAVLVLAWVVLNFLLADPKFGTPAINWTLHTFGDKGAAVQTAKLSKPFSSRFEMTKLDWPGTAEAEIINLDYDLFAFLPGHPFVKKLIVRNGEVMLENKTDNKRTLNPQKLVDAVAVENVTLKFTRRDKLREVTIINASGAFSSGTVTGTATSGDNHLTFTRLRREWDGGLRGDIAAKGENLKDLAEIVGASAPDTAPFDVKGELRMRESVWSVSGITGRMGDSDIGGDVSVDLKPKKPFLNVALKSKKLDFDDLGVVFGIPLGTGKGETTNEEQRDAKVAFARSNRLIPDTHIDFARLAAVNADMTFDAAQVVDAPSGINGMAFKGTLRDQVLDFERFFVQTGTGTLDAKVKINATKDPATTRATGSLQKVAITRIVNTPFVKGTLNGAFRLDMTGSGFRDAFGSATGEAGIWSTNSEVAKIATEAAGLDLGEILLLLARNEDREYLKSRCLAANVAFKDGVATLSPAIIDNKDSLIYAEGGFNLKNESLDIKIKAAPHDVSIGKVFGDIKVTGTMRHPQLMALNTKTLLQAGLTAVLAGITGALAALPFVELGGEPEAPCTQLLADSRSLNGKTTAPPVAKSEQKQKS